MKIKDFKETERKVAKIRKIKKETDPFLKKKDYILEQIDDKTWRYHWIREED